MSEQQEINLRREQEEWQARQNSSGMMAAAMCAATICGFVYFLSDPGKQSAMLLGLAMLLLLAACVRLISCAAKVVGVRNSLQPQVARVEVIDVEVVDQYRSPNRYQIPGRVGSRY